MNECRPALCCPQASVASVTGEDRHCSSLLMAVPVMMCGCRDGGHEPRQVSPSPRVRAGGDIRIQLVSGSAWTLELQGGVEVICSGLLEPLSVPCVWNSITVPMRRLICNISRPQINPSWFPKGSAAVLGAGIWCWHLQAESCKSFISFWGKRSESVLSWT